MAGVEFKDSKLYYNLCSQYGTNDVKLNGNRVEIKKPDGSVTSFFISEEDMTDAKLEPGQSIMDYIQNSVGEQLDDQILNESLEAGFLTEKKSFFDGEHYVFDVNKYRDYYKNKGQEKDITLGEIKKMYGIPDRVLSEYNTIGFKDHYQKEPRDLDSAKIEDVLPSMKLKIPKDAMFKTNGWQENSY